MEMSPLISIIVPNHNRAKLLKDCLLSLLAQSYSNKEMIIVDNASSDHSCGVVASLQDRASNIRLLDLPENLGFAGACNAGIRLARGEMIALLNNDAVADVTWLERLVEAIRISPEVGMCASKILYRKSGIIDKAGHLMYPDGQNRGRGSGELDQGQFSKLEETFFADGCAALYRRRLLEEVQGFDENFFAYGDDADLGIRARWMGWKCLYVPDAVVHHHHSATTGPYSAQKVYWIERNRLWLAIKNFPTPLLVLSPFWTLNRWAWNLAAALTGHGAAGNFCRQSSLRLLLQTWGRAYRDGFREIPSMLRQRRQIRRSRRISDFEFYRLLYRFRAAARTLAFQDIIVPTAAAESGSGAPLHAAARHRRRR